MTPQDAGFFCTKMEYLSPDETQVYLRMFNLQKMGFKPIEHQSAGTVESVPKQVVSFGNLFRGFDHLGDVRGVSAAVLEHRGYFERPVIRAGVVAIPDKSPDKVVGFFGDWVRVNGPREVRNAAAVSVLAKGITGFPWRKGGVPEELVTALGNILKGSEVYYRDSLAHIFPKTNAELLQEALEEFLIQKQGECLHSLNQETERIRTILRYELTGRSG
ncbi:MAG: hypothetical protein US86_C0001G0299 [Candidatus Daviesbacteria bacterium GW2011_GWA2_38_24]|uniref:Uncharacterized protein n=1 Tax=Candidatus Daviesbacteria bacterium GW2011_GWA2_38_24 TaxID=1618422 RepID=A0A0G0JKH9_9BACT|nr:MAG: hypothetical protein US86_C0001G0299 [Candidatus Daviesbacteria bacterium GW2011_GWA2_38_24]OGE23903.1 MAG: hypothetical protein A2688_02225 [Candidatus Daviesbacteria bacterium RIFCSPHIGHO2_01_FULL_38_8]